MMRVSRLLFLLPLLVSLSSVSADEAGEACLAFNPQKRKWDLPGYTLGPNCYKPIALAEAQVERCRGIATRTGPSGKSCHVIGSFYDFAAPRTDQAVLTLGELYHQDGSWRDYFISGEETAEKARQQFETNCRLNGFQCSIRATAGGPPGWFAVAMSAPGRSPKVFLNAERGAASAAGAWTDAKQQCETATEATCSVVLIFWKEKAEE